MAGYLVLARKYRSTTFDEVVGQDAIAQTLKNAIAGGRIAHAYLFAGTRGVGKTTMARILAKALNCQAGEGPTVTPCNRCDACVAIARGDDLDVVEIDGASNRGIDEIRQLRANAIFAPARCRYKIYYIDEVHQITRDAFNALLKTLEEPPPHVKFIFATTEAEKIPATILSRCQRFDFRNIPTRQIAQHLAAVCKAEKVQAEADALFRVARAAGGSMRDALSLLDQLLSTTARVADADVVRILGTPSDQRVLAMVQAIAAGDAATALKELAGLLEGGSSLTLVVTALADCYRNIMLALTCGADSELIELGEAQKAALVELAKKFSLPAAVSDLAMLARLAYNVRLSSVGRALVEATLVRLADADQFVDARGLLERLDSLSSGAPPKGGVSRLGPAGAGGEKKKHFSEVAEASPPPQGTRIVTAGAARPPAAGQPPVPPAAGGAQPPAAPAQTARPPAVRELSSAEKQQVHDDPAVRRVLDLFGGQLVDVRKELPPAGAENHTVGS